MVEDWGGVGVSVGVESYSKCNRYDQTTNTRVVYELFYPRGLGGGGGGSEVFLSSIDGVN